MLKIWTRTGILWVAYLLFTSQEMFMAFHHYSRWAWWVLICSHFDWILHPLHVDFAIWWKKQAFEAIAKRTTQFFRSTVMLSSHSFFGLLQVSDTKPFEHWKKNILFSNCAKTWTHIVYCLWHICLIILQNMIKPHVSIQLILCISNNPIAVQ